MAVGSAVDGAIDVDHHAAADQVGQGADGGQTRRGGGRRQPARRECPERPLHRVGTDQHQAQQDHRGRQGRGEHTQQEAHGDQQHGERGVPATFAGPIRAAAPEDHRHGGQAIGNGIGEADLQIGQAKGLEQLRRPDAHGAAGRRGARVDQRHYPDVLVLEQLPQGYMTDAGLAPALLGQLERQPVALLIAQPPGLLRAIGQHEQAGDT